MNVFLFCIFVNLHCARMICKLLIPNSNRHGVFCCTKKGLNFREQNPKPKFKLSDNGINSL